MISRGGAETHPLNNNEASNNSDDIFFIKIGSRRGT